MLHCLLNKHNAANMFPVTWHSPSQSEDCMFNIQPCWCGNLGQWDGVVGGWAGSANQSNMIEIEIKCLVDPLDNKLELRVRNSVRIVYKIV